MFMDDLNITKKEIWDKELPKIDLDKKDQYVGNRLSYTKKEFDKKRKKIMKMKLP